jgi:methylated-DNA-[protein]-cysteine S-methyltransferase
MAFSDEVLRIVRAIPKGSTLTYKAVAERAGYPRAFRAVGAVMKANYDPSVPCHRVIRSNGAAGNYNRGAKKKVELLRSEGYQFK